MKNLLLFLTFFVTTSTLFSQLYVQPNGTTDSYVFVSDEILFVEQDVNLVTNTNNADTEASIYLRDGAQLIQGGSNTPNKGSGLLSVYQNAPDSDQWTYNYWCSPIGNPLYLGTGVDGNKNMSIRILYDIQNLTNSIPTIRTSSYDGTSSPLTISKRWIYTKLRGWEAETDYQHVGDTHYIPTGIGFTMKGVDNTPVPITGFEYDFRGRPNNGDIPVSVYNGELTLSGNPYPSSLDLNRVFYDTQAGDFNGTSNSGNNEINEFYFWDENKDANSHSYQENEGGYGIFVPGASNPDGKNGDVGFIPGIYTPAVFSIWNSSGGSTNTGNNGLHYERRFAPIGQGVLFFAGASGTISLKNAHRRYILEGVGNNSQFRSSGDSSVFTDPENPDPSPSVDNTLPQLRINTSFGTSHIRQMVLAFSDESTDGFDRGFDGRHPMDASSEVYFPIGQDNDIKKYVIQTVPFSLEKRVPINFTLNRQFIINLTYVEKINIEGAVYLWDSQENIYREITNGNSLSDNNNSFILPAGNYENRYYIVFRGRRATEENSEGTIAKEEVRANVDFFQNNPVKQLEISNPEGYTIKSAAIYDMSGKLVVNKSNLGNSFKITVGTSNLSDGVYLIKLLTSENINIDYKMIIQNK